MSFLICITKKGNLKLFKEECLRNPKHKPHTPLTRIRANSPFSFIISKQFIKVQMLLFGAILAKSKKKKKVCY